MVAQVAVRSDRRIVTGVDLRQRLADELEAVRQRSLDLLAPLDDDALLRQHSPLMSPLVWDLAHVGNYEELWLLREVAGAAPIDAALDDVYDAFRHPRPNRPSLPLLGPAEARRYLRRRAGPGARRPGARPTSTATRPAAAGRRVRLRDGRPARAPARRDHAGHPPAHGRRRLPAPGPAPAGRRSTRSPSGEVLVPAGPFVMGTDAEPLAYDNERPAHVVDLPAFRIDAAPVTNGRYLEFVARRRLRPTPSWWDGRRAGRGGEKATSRHPQFWRAGGPGLVAGAVRLPRGPAPRRARAARVLVRGRRLRPVGGQAAAHRGGVGEGGVVDAGRASSAATRGATRRPTPATAANLGGGLYRPAPVGAYPDGASAYGCHQMVGDVWEWTASRLRALPRLRVLPLPGVLRGLLRARLQGAAGRVVGHVAGGGAEHLPQLGLPHPPPDLRRLPLRPRRVGPCAASSATWGRR